MSELDKEQIQRIVDKTKEMLPSDAKLLWLSFTGSRAFGWGLKNFDYDIHGVYYKPGWFDYVHFGGNIGGMGVDLNLHESEHVLRMAFFHPSFETLVNLTNPIYVEYEDVYDLFMREIVSRISKLFFYRSTVENQISWLKGYFHPRTALHTYRVLLQPIYYVRKRKIKHNIFEIIEELGLDLKGPYICREAYNEGYQVSDKEQKLVWEEINMLKKMYDEEINNPHFSAATDWKHKDYREWYKFAEKIIRHIEDYLSEKFEQ